VTPVQKVLYELLIEFDEICTKHDITYYLGGGTALGAIRNGGFLPWDNDMDLYMPRREYKKLCEVIDLELKEDRFFVNKERNPYYLNPIARYGNSNTTKLYFSFMTDGESCGQHFDILIFDPFPNDSEEQQKYRDLLRIYCEILQPYFVVARETYKHSKVFNYSLYKDYMRQVEERGKAAVIQELEEYLFSFPDEEAELYCMNWGLDVLCYNRAYFGNPRRVPFEDRLFPIAEKAEQIFRLAYGDNWMLLPPKEFRIAKRAADNCDLPVKLLVDLYHKGYDRDKAVADFAKYKDAQLYLRLIREGFDKKRCQKAIDRATRKVNPSFSVEEYLDLQLNVDALKYEVCVDAPIAVVNESLSVLLKRGKFGVVAKIIARRRQQQMPASEETLRIEKVAGQMRDLSVAYYDKHDIAHIADFFTKDEELDIPFFAAMKNVVLLENFDDEELKKMDLYESLSKKLEDRDYFEDDLFSKTAADIFVKLGQIDKANELYSAVLSRANHALLIRDIEKLKKEGMAICKSSGFTSDFVQRAYRAEKKALKDKLTLKNEPMPRRIKSKIDYICYILLQPINSDFNIRNTLAMRKNFIESKRVIDKHRSNYRALKNLAQRLG